MKKFFLVLITFVCLFYGCKKSGTKPQPTAPIVEPVVTPLNIVVSKLTPATYLSLSLVDSKGVIVYTITSKNVDTTYQGPAVNAGDQFIANVSTNIAASPGPDGVADIKFVFKGTIVSELSGGIYKSASIPVNVPTVAK